MWNDTIDRMLPDNPQPNGAFSKWWADFGAVPANEQSEEVAIAGWDAALRVAWLVLCEEMDVLMKQRRYEEAAAILDCRKRMEMNFTLPDRWGVKQHWFEQDVERDEEFFRGLSPGQLEKLRSTTTFSPNGSYAVALDRILRKRGENHSST
jgi:hypothetical protein